MDKEFNTLRTILFCILAVIFLAVSAIHLNDESLRVSIGSLIVGGICVILAAISSKDIDNNF